MEKTTRKTDSRKRAKQIKWVFLILFTYTIFTLISCKEKQVLPNLYSNPEAGFSFEYPDGYQRGSSEGGVVRLYFKRQGFNEAKLPEIVGSIVEKEGNPTFDAIAENFLQEMQTIPEGSQFKMKRKETVMLRRKTEALRFKVFWVYTYTDHPEYQYEMVNSVIVAFNKKKDHWILLSVADWTGYDTTPKEISDILLSLKMLK